MKKVLLIFMISILLGLSNVSAEDTQSGAVNTSPVAVDDMVNTGEDVSVNIFVTSNDTDTWTGILMVTWVANVLNWSWVINWSWTGVIFTPSLNFNWTWSFSYTVSDWELTDTWNVLVVVNPVNDVPVAVDDSVTMVKNTSVSINLVVNDSDVDWNSLKVTLLWNILNWTWVINSAWTWVVFTPNQGFIWTVNFSYTISDWVLTDVWNVTIHVVDGNIVPVAVNDTLITNQNTAKTIDPRVNDSDANWDILTISWVTLPMHWISSFTGTSVTYTPNNDYFWSDSFNYTIVDWKWWSATWKVNVEVRKVDREWNDDNWHDDYKHEVQNLQKEYLNKFKELKDQYKDKEWKKEYLTLKENLRAEYLMKLKDITWQNNTNNKAEKNKKYKYEWDTAKNNYINVLQNKYWSKITRLDDSWLNVLIWKIDNLITTTNAWNYSDDAKAKYNTILLALRSIVVDNLNNSFNVLNLDSLFE